jgi:hypothetical protein
MNFGDLDWDAPPVDDEEPPSKAPRPYTNWSAERLRGAVELALPGSCGGDLDDAQEWLRQRLFSGETCPCCLALAKIYRRKLHASIARAAIFLWHCGNDGEGGWVDVAEQAAARRRPDITRSREHPKLAYWGLSEMYGGEGDTGGRYDGKWRLTESGRLFVSRQLTVPSHAVIYNGRVLELDGSPVGIVAALGKKFSYEELMEGA